MSTRLEPVVGACIVLSSLGWACGGSLPCASSSSCAQGSICAPTGRCEPAPEQTGVGPAVLLSPTDWAATNGALLERSMPDMDVLVLGGAHESDVHIAFRLPRRGPATGSRLAAELRLHPHPSYGGPLTTTSIHVTHTGPFHGEHLSRATAPTAFGSPVAQRRLEPGPARPMSFDVSNVVARLAQSGASDLFLRLRAVGAPAVRIASPRVVSRHLRPVLVLTVRR